MPSPHLKIAPFSMLMGSDHAPSCWSEEVQLWSSSCASSISGSSSSSCSFCGSIAGFASSFYSSSGSSSSESLSISIGALFAALDGPSLLASFFEYYFIDILTVLLAVGGAGVAWVSCVIGRELAAKRALIAVSRGDARVGGP
ncbi:hypothetical protein PIB30_064146 [Stylosanthes scabra]|uniref:Uncharacterized protein n=1 Tax=Stylosanthes scabra TaxID=79078 RepID=A0ABU6SLM6_9FABA|nr:hypothetical protein [Stylosanthes scabra]